MLQGGIHSAGRTVQSATDQTEPFTQAQQTEAVTPKKLLGSKVLDTEGEISKVKPILGAIQCIINTNDRADSTVSWGDSSYQIIVGILVALPNGAKWE